MDRFIAIGEAFKAPSVLIMTLSRRETEGKLIPERTAVGHRRNDLAKLKPEMFHTGPGEQRTVAYERVFSHGQKDDLERQKQLSSNSSLWCVIQLLG